MLKAFIKEGLTLFALLLLTGEVVFILNVLCGGVR